MFEKKEYIFSETMGVCKVADIVKLSPNNRLGEPVWYYQLKPAFEKSKAAYIPVENHQVNLRPLIDRKKAEALSEEELKKLDVKHREEVRFVLEDRLMDKDIKKISK